MIDLKLYYAPWRRRFELLVSERSGFNYSELAFGQPITLQKVNTDVGQEQPPALAFEETAAQQLMNDLWNAGIRPTDSNVGSLKAVDAHLQDMRKIAFMFLEKKNGNSKT